MATTHVDLRIRAEKQGIKTRVIHGASIISAAIGLSSLQNCKFGKSVTIPFPQENVISETPYKTILENKVMGLHTLCLLDLKVEEKCYMTIKEGLELLLAVEKGKKKHVATLNTLVVGIARAGSPTPIVKTGYLGELIDYDFGVPPHTLIFPSRLHFMEAEALVALAKAPERIRETVE
jgi:diphthine synthase